jgi:hypothetical protein
MNGSWFLLWRDGECYGTRDITVEEFDAKKDAVARRNELLDLGGMAFAFIVREEA